MSFNHLDYLVQHTYGIKRQSDVLSTNYSTILVVEGNFLHDDS